VNLFHQPSNSPDLNLFDPGYFAAIQALQQWQHREQLMILLQW
jgi:hypothetical protein